LEKTNYLLTFVTDTQEKLTLNIPLGDPAVGRIQAENARNGIIAGGIVETAKGTPTEIHSASRRTVLRDELFPA
jgi:hypothetical protein